MCTRVTFDTSLFRMNRKLSWVEPQEPLPDTSLALTIDEGANGLLAAGADLGVSRLVEAYSRGIFPWFSQGEPVLWWTPSPRMVLYLDEFKVSKSFRKEIQRVSDDPSIRVTADQDFAAMMQSCAQPRSSGSGTWISPPMIAAYHGLHQQGLAHSVHVMQGEQCIGGLYCVSLGRMVFGESMFSARPGASKIALAALVGWLNRHQGLVIDCQQHNAHLASLGGREIDRSVFESHVRELSVQNALPWALDPPSKNDLTLVVRPL